MNDPPPAPTPPWPGEPPPARGEPPPAGGEAPALQDPPFNPDSNDEGILFDENLVPG